MNNKTESQGQVNLFNIIVDKDERGKYVFKLENSGEGFILTPSEVSGGNEILKSLSDKSSDVLNREYTKDEISKMLQHPEKNLFTEIILALHHKKSEALIEERHKKLVMEFGSTNDIIVNQLKLLSYELNEDIPILLLGEPRVGKTWLAKAIHKVMRPEDPKMNNFKNISVAAVNDETIASELFGHKAGAFTGAKSDQIGLFEAAEGGTILLDDIDLCSYKMQGSLLKVIDEKTFRPVGETNDRILKNVRIIFATNRDLKSLVKTREFRDDLYARITKGATFLIPPLRERTEDIPVFAQIFAKGLAKKGSLPLAFKKEDFEKLKGLKIGKGNLAELEAYVTDMYNRSLMKKLRFIEVADQKSVPPTSELSELEQQLKGFMQKWDYEKNGNFLENFIQPVVIKVGSEVFPLNTKNAAKIIGLGKDKKDKDGFTAFDRARNRYKELLETLNKQNI
jgi:transcriptional regulator with GAF, ATPase, and Fis domain